MKASVARQTLPIESNSCSGVRSLRAHEHQDASAGRKAIRLPRPASHQNACAGGAIAWRRGCEHGDSPHHQTRGHTRLRELRGSIR